MAFCGSVRRHREDALWRREVNSREAPGGKLAQRQHLVGAALYWRRGNRQVERVTHLGDVRDISLRLHAECIDPEDSSGGVEHWAAASAAVNVDRRLEAGPCQDSGIAPYRAVLHDQSVIKVWAQIYAQPTPFRVSSDSQLWLTALWFAEASGAKLLRITPS